MQPYDDHGGITIFHADCRDVLPTLGPADLVLTDPPYPDYYTDLYTQTPIDCLSDLGCRQLIFWSARCDFPLTYTAIHVWDKQVGISTQYERIFERNGSKEYRLYRGM